MAAVTGDRPMVMHVRLPDGNVRPCEFKNEAGHQRYPRTALEIVERICQELRFRPSSFRLCSLYKQRGRNADTNWLEPNKPISPEALTAGTETNLYFRIRLKPRNLLEFFTEDPAAATFLQKQLHNQFMSEDISATPFLKLNLCILNMISFLIEEFHNMKKRCSQTPMEEALQHIKDNCGGYEAFMMQTVIDEYSTEQLAIEIENRIRSKKLWPRREGIVITEYLRIVQEYAMFGSEQYTVQIDGDQGRVNINPDGVELVDVMDQPTLIPYHQMNALDMKLSTELTLTEINGTTHTFEADSYARAETIVSLINTYAEIHAGRRILNIDGINTPFGDPFPHELDRSAAQMELLSYASVPGAYLVSKRALTGPRDASFFRLTYIAGKRAGPQHLKITQYPSSSTGIKYGINDGMRYVTIDELMEHYHNETDGLLVKLRYNIKAARNMPPEETEFGFGTEVAPARALLDAQNYVLERPQPTQDELARVTVSHDAIARLQKLGEGQFGEVFKGKFTRSGQSYDVALKVLKDQASPDEFMLEASVMVHLDHPNIVRLLGVAREAPLTLVMELVAYGDLHNYLKANRSDPARTGIDILHSYIVQIAKGMEHLASKGLVHRDLAARNVLVASVHQVKINDFGLSRVLGNSDYYTASERGMWPIKWYAPESIYNNRFHEKVVELLNSGQRLERPADCNDALWNILQQCWQYDADRRPAFRELVMQTQGATKSQAVAANPFDIYSRVRQAQGAFEQVDFDPKKPDGPQLSRRASDHVTKSPLHLASSTIQVGEMISRGTFGPVFRGVWQRGSDALQVAVRKLMVQEDADIEGFMREANNMHRLQHECLVRLFGVTTGEQLMLVTELAPAGALDRYLRANPHKSISEILRLMFCVARGMQYMAGQGYVHRDLAARNVMVFGELNCKISDFGLSRGLGFESEYYRASNRGRWPIKWYAPESLYHSRFTSKSDVWSFGVTLWEGDHHGAKPYSGMKGREVLEFLESNKRLEPTASLPTWAAELMQTCWYDDPDHRPTFDEIVDTFKRFL